MTTSKKLIVIVGATGSGKTDLSIDVAKRYGAPIISTDSRQFYRELPIGTAQPDAEQLASAEHHFIASHSIVDEFNCGRYEVEALKSLDTLFKTHDTVVAVGGSGLYIKALCEGMDDMPTADKELRETLQARLQNEGLQVLTEELKRLDPEYYEQVDRNNSARVVRALEVCLQTGKPYSQQRLGQRQIRNFKIIKIGLDIPREELYERINRRVDMMIQAGLEVEARNVFSQRKLNSLQTVGYRELFDYFDGNITRARAIELIKQNTRHYAKRQMTWFRRDEQIRWFGTADVDAIVEYIERAK